ncbi:TPA: hypothetical protein SMG08_001658 [Serratia marcescens]|uniref:hypothetical protein n=1 Tax=Serratia marcescens TaxID=615 RepID=UPI0021BD2BA1|nr:hypothetical protein [Serratia marcescens]HEJ7270065.1 hypothetical protein [Serratia marcescens]
MYIDVLRFLASDDGVKYVACSVNSKNGKAIDLTKTLGVIRDLSGKRKNGDPDALTKYQRVYYDKYIEDLIVRVHCEGNYSDGECESGNYVDPDSLLVSYQDEDFRCSSCRTNAE